MMKSTQYDVVDLTLHEYLWIVGENRRMCTICAKKLLQKMRAETLR